jgi:hypothetical protein
MKMRCKVRVDSVKRWSGNFEEIVFDAVSGGTKENESFAQATPSGKLVITVTNPAVLGQIRPGEEYYLDLTPVSQA